MPLFSSPRTDIVMHLLSTRFAVNSTLWLDSCALVVAVSNRSVEMVKLLLDSCYSSPPGGQVCSEVNRALLETVYEYGEEKDSTNRTHQDNTTYEIIQLLITEGGANPHLPSLIQFPGYMKSLSEYDGEIQEETPLTAAVRAGDPVALQCMMKNYSTSLQEAKQERRRDPMLTQQPESYFRLLEEREDDIIHSSIDAALVASLFLLRYTGNLDYGKCSLVLYEQSTHGNLSQQGLQWLEKCIATGRLIPTLPHGITSESDDSFEVALIRYHIPSCRGEKKSKSINDLHHQGDTHMDWSYVLATLPWFKTRMNGVNCNWLKRVMSDPKLQEVDYQRAVNNDEFDLVVEGGVKLCAHRSIVSAKCGKLAAQIRFTESNSSDGDRLNVHVDLPQLVAKMLLSHIYHGSIVFGLRGSSTEQCQQLLELALLAEEYLCPSLLLECELRLLERSSCTLCICPQCSGGKQISTNHVSSTDQVAYRAELQCLEKARDNLDESLSMFCQPNGVHIYKSSVVSSKSKSIITAQNGLDILAVAQQLECSQFNQQSLYRLKNNLPSTNSTNNGLSKSSLSNQFEHISLQGESNKDEVTTQSIEKISIMEKDNDDTEYMSVPFVAAKSMAVRSMLSNFPVVLKSESYARQCKNNSYQEEADMDEIDDESFTSQADKNENGVLLLQACLEEL